MKVFIAGAKSIKKIDDIIEKKLVSISQKSYDVLIGDCHGVDKAVQNFFTTFIYFYSIFPSSRARGKKKYRFTEKKTKHGRPLVAT